MSQGERDKTGASQTVTRERAGLILEAYGADAAHWPPVERRAVQEWLDRDEALRALAREMAALDMLLDEADPALSVEPSTAFRERILSDAAEALAPQTPQKSKTRQPLSRSSGKPAGVIGAVMGWLGGLDRSVGDALRLPVGWRPGTVLASSAVLGLTLGLAIPATAPAGGRDAIAADSDYLLMVAFDPILATGDWTTGPDGGPVPGEGQRP